MKALRATPRRLDNLSPDQIRAIWTRVNGIYEQRTNDPKLRADIERPLEALPSPRAEAIYCELDEIAPAVVRAVVAHAESVGIPKETFVPIISEALRDHQREDQTSVG